MADGGQNEANGDHGHDDHHHGPDYLAHHFETTEQQYDASKLGIWIFLLTEILFFSGLFVAYTLYRYHHPEIFTQASEYLDTAMGAINTIVLLFSSLTMAWAVRCAQMEQRRGLILTLLITLFCAAIFLGIKAVEYTHKWDLGIFVRSAFDYHEAAHHGISESLIWLSMPFLVTVIVLAALCIFAKGTGNDVWFKFFGLATIGVSGYFAGVGVGLAYEPIKASIAGDSHAEAHADDHSADKEAHGDDHGEEADEPADAEAGDDEAAVDSGLDRNIGIFFSIYYFMTGLHGFHVLGGMVAIAWLLFRAVRGDFYRDYFGPVDNVGLYWHLVDLIWIYLFPLLYLIG